MVYSLAAMATLNPHSSKVADVTGPMDAMRMPLRFGRPRPLKATKFLTVEELVKVMTCGRAVALHNAVCNFCLDLFGTTVS